MTRTSFADAAPTTFRKLLSLDRHIKASLGAELGGLVSLHASVLNGCSFCVDKHSGELAQLGVPNRKVFAVGAWRESPFFDDTERVALAFTDALTGGISEIDDHLWDRAGALLGEERRSDLIVAVGTINTFNMSGITTHKQPQE